MADDETIKFFVPGKPQGKGRPRAVARGRFVRMYTPEKTVTYESTVALMAAQAMQGRPPSDKPALVSLDVGLPVPESWSKKRKKSALDGAIRPKKPDLDNVIKAIFDAMNNIVWVDDVQVVYLISRKRYTEIPGVDVEVSFTELP